MKYINISAHVEILICDRVACATRATDLTCKSDISIYNMMECAVK